MSRLTLRLPNSLHNQVRSLAEHENISINQYVVYALTRQVTQAYDVLQVPEKTIREERATYRALLEGLGESSFEEIQKTLDERQEVETDANLSVETMQKMKERISSASVA